nr:MAG TPA: hypothetical protein [Caudoviricetes sp.]
MYSLFYVGAFLRYLELFIWQAKDLNNKLIC